ncbi:MAG TPA: glycosyl hydrolase family 17 protein, partial [Clostridia bacterium]|nr:glycosyl hydrolase family 17 protein [Clostridia bacterium]
LKHPKVMEVCDVILINCYPFWEGCRLEDSIMSLNNMYQKVKKAGKGKEVIISETGWPSDGKSIGKAIPSKNNAQKFLKSVLEWVKTKKVKCFYFTGFDESWKAVHEGDLGAYWGIFDNNGAFKFNLDSFKDLSVKTMPKESFLPVDGIFIPSGYMGSTENIKLERVAANSGDIRKYMKISLLNKNQSGEWSGIYWQYPANNWGNKHGLNLFQPQKLTFYAKGDKGGEYAEFKVGGISGDFADSINPAIGTNLVKLSNRWVKYSIDIGGRDASSVIGGFCCVASRNYNPSECVLYLANIQFEW